MKDTPAIAERGAYRAMYMFDELEMKAPVEACFRAAADVERWPDILPHYRWVRFHRKDGFGTGRVEMAARRSFGPLSYPVWWVSEMRLDEDRPAVLYRHVAGVTREMDVEWGFEELGPSRTGVRILHAWGDGPRWPLPKPARRLISASIIGPLFIHHVASRTLRGIRSAVEGAATAGSRS
jgi:ribosome-associated toxin RatA of RatAB toxin-antitoxin module